MTDNGRAASGLAVRVAAGEAAAPIVTAAIPGVRLALEWDGLSLNIPVRPDEVSVLQCDVR